MLAFSPWYRASPLNDMFGCEQYSSGVPLCLCHVELICLYRHPRQYLRLEPAEVVLQPAAAFARPGLDEVR